MNVPLTVVLTENTECLRKTPSVYSNQIILVVQIMLTRPDSTSAFQVAYKQINSHRRPY